MFTLIRIVLHRDYSTPPTNDPSLQDCSYKGEHRRIEGLQGSFGFLQGFSVFLCFVFQGSGV